MAMNLLLVVSALSTTPTAQMCDDSYLEAFGRKPTPDELQYWESHCNGCTEETMVHSHMDFLRSPENDAELGKMITRSYQAVMHRSPKSTSDVPGVSELDYWKREIRAHVPQGSDPEDHTYKKLCDYHKEWLYAHGQGQSGSSGSGGSAPTKPSITHTIRGGQVLVSGSSFARGSNVDFQISVSGSLFGAPDLRTGYAQTAADGSGSFSDVPLDLRTILPDYKNPGGSGEDVLGAAAGERVAMVAKNANVTTYDNNQSGVSNVDSFIAPP